MGWARVHFGKIRQIYKSIDESIIDIDVRVQQRDGTLDAIIFDDKYWVETYLLTYLFKSKHDKNESNDKSTWHLMKI